MKQYKNAMKRLGAVFLIFTAVFMLNSCGSNTEKVLIADNSKMSDETRAELDKLTRGFEVALESADISKLTEYKDESFTATDEELISFFESRKNENKNPFVKYDEYYLENIKVNDEHITVYRDENAKNYIELYPKSPEFYVALYASDNEKISSMASLIAAKPENEWKIMWIDISDYKYNGKTAKEIHETAKGYLNDGKLLPAFIYAEMMFNVIQPGKVMKYSGFEEMEETYSEIKGKLAEDLELPLTVPELDGIEIYVIGLSNHEEKGLIPLVTYKTETPVSDEAESTAEGKRVIEELDKRFSGFRDEFEFVALNMTNDDLTNADANIAVEQIVLPMRWE